MEEGCECMRNFLFFEYLNFESVLESLIKLHSLFDLHSILYSIFLLYLTQLRSLSSEGYKGENCIRLALSFSRHHHQLLVVDELLI